jgi:acyl carrier protein
MTAPPSPPTPHTGAPTGGDVAERVCRIVADVLGLGPGEISPESGPHSIKKWDSINHLNVMLAIEGEFGVSFTPEEVDRFDRVSAIIRRLQPATASPDGPSRTTAGGLVIRRLEPGDLDAVVGLLDRRDGTRHSPAAVQAYFCDLDSARLLGWIAEDAGRPVGMTVAYRRQIYWAGRELNAGYWAHLYVAEEHRRRLVYPRLVHAMMAEGTAAGLDMIYTGMRRQAVADAHQSLGFRPLGHIAVCVKPLRPLALLSRYRGWNAIESLGAPLDALYGRFALAQDRREGIRVEATDATSPHVPELIEMLEQQAGMSVRRLWSVREWRDRFATTLEGCPYTLLLAFAGDTLAGGLLLRQAERRSETGREPVRIGVVMDLVTRETSRGVVRALLADAERRTLAAGGHAMLWLDGVPTLRELVAHCGYRPTSETYRMIVWPEGCLAGMTQVLPSWRFPFAEHDAF